MGLADDIRQQVDRGELPSRNPDSVFGGFGHGGFCAACDDRIHPHQVTYGLKVAETATLSIHSGCFRLWKSDFLARVADCRGGLPRQMGPAGGMDLGEAIRGKIERGELPSRLPDKISTNVGHGQPCVACDEAIMENDTSCGFESLSLHFPCFSVWIAELTRRD